MNVCCDCKKELEPQERGSFCGPCIQKMSDGYRSQDALDAIFNKDN